MENKIDYIISCTSGVDIDRQLIKDNSIECINYKYLLDEVEYDDDYYASYNENKFYEDLINGSVIKTSQAGYGRYEEFFENLLKQGKDIIHIGLSSGITGDTQTAMAVAKELNEKHQNKVYVVDSTCASSGYGMFVLMVAKKRDESLSLKELLDYIEINKYTIHHWFISSDLTFYVRGGRISNVEGFFGKAFKICPLLYVDYDGKLTPYEKIRTKLRAIEGQFEKMKEYCKDGDAYSEDVFICNSICRDDAEILANMIKEYFKNVKNVYITSIGPSIGAHTGPNTISLFFVGKNRNEILKED